MTRRGEMQEVELHDVADGPVDTAGSPPGVDAAPGSTGRSRARRRWMILGAAALAVALGVTQWVVTSREAAAQARLAQVPGVLSPVGETLDVVRRVPGADAAELFGIIGGGVERADDGAQSFAWVDPAGGPGWTTELLGPTSALAGADHVYGGTTCQSDNEPATELSTAHRIVCLVTDGGMPMKDGRGDTTVGASSREVVVLSISDGSVEARWPVDRGQAVALMPHDVVVVGSLTADAGQVTAYDLLTGAERWTHETHLLTMTGYAEGGMGVSLFRAGDLVAYSTEGRLTLLSAAGEVVRDDLGYQDGVGGGWMTDATTGALVVQEHTRDGTFHMTLLAADGDPARDLTVDGQVVLASVDDRSVPGLVLSYDTALHGWDVGTRTIRWSLDASQTTSALILRGTVYAATARGIVALDGTTGERLWSRQGDDTGSFGTLMTDGRHVLLATDTSGTPGADGTDVPRMLVAYDLASGEKAFSVPYPEGISPLGAADRSLVGYDQATDEYVVLG